MIVVLRNVLFHVSRLFLPAVMPTVPAILSLVDTDPLFLLPSSLSLHLEPSDTETTVFVLNHRQLPYSSHRSRQSTFRRESTDTDQSCWLSAKNKLGRQQWRLQKCWLHSTFLQRAFHWNSTRQLIGIYQSSSLLRSALSSKVVGHFTNILPTTFEDLPPGDFKAVDFDVYINLQYPYRSSGV